MFALSCAVDLFGQKQNVKLEFPACPSMTELINAVESQFDVLSRAARPAGYPDVAFRAQTFQVYDDILLRWVDVYTAAQLTNGCQLFCFQPESIWHSDSQGIIPEAKDAVTWVTSAGSPRRNRVHVDTSVAPGLAEKLRCVFYDMDTDSKGCVTYEDLRTAFTKADMETTYVTMSELFVVADENRDGELTYDEWIRFAIKYPNVVDALFFRAREGARAGEVVNPHSPGVAAVLGVPPGLMPRNPAEGPVGGFTYLGRQDVRQAQAAPPPPPARAGTPLGNPLPFFPHHTASSAEVYKQQTAAVLAPRASAAAVDTAPQSTVGGGARGGDLPPFPTHLAPSAREAAERDFAAAKRAADDARAAKHSAERREQEAWDRMHAQYQRDGGVGF